MGIVPVEGVPDTKVIRLESDVVLKRSFVVADPRTDYVSRVGK